MVVGVTLCAAVDSERQVPWAVFLKTCKFARLNVHVDMCHVYTSCRNVVHTWLC